MKQTLNSLGWTMFDECKVCNGKVQYYNHPDRKGYVIRTRENRNTFRIELNNRAIGGPFMGYELEQRINQYVK